jgi:hypothetical protein
MLGSRGIQSILLVQREPNGAPQPDLAHTLRRWQQGGLSMLRCSVAELETSPAPVHRPFTVSRPAGFRLLWSRLLVGFGLRRNPLGGFGGMLADPSSAG